MKVSTFWRVTAAQNLALKTATFATSIALFISAIVNLSLLNRDPLIIDRGCDSSTKESSSILHTESEVTSFLNRAVSERFNFEAKNWRDFLSRAEIQKRQKEQRKLAKQRIIQKVIVDRIDFENKLIVADRLIRIGEVRSAFPLKFHFSLKEVKRSEANPYGLILLKVSEAKPKKKP